VPEGTTDADVAGFIVSLADAGNNCRNAVAWLRDWSAGLK